MRTRAALLALALSLLLALSSAATGPAATAQGNPEPQVPSGDIVPRPNSGQEPEEAGDRGGALQLLLPALIIAAIGGGVWHISRQARSARGQAPAAETDQDPRL